MPHLEQELIIYLISPPIFSGVRVARSLVFCVMFCRSLFVNLSYFFLAIVPSVHFDLRLLITPLVSSNFSYKPVNFCIYVCTTTITTLFLRSYIEACGNNSANGGAQFVPIRMHVETIVHQTGQIQCILFGFEFMATTQLTFRISWYLMLLLYFTLLAHGRWLSTASPTTKTGHHDIAKILLKVALKRQK